MNIKPLDIDKKLKFLNEQQWSLNEINTEYKN